MRNKKAKALRRIARVKTIGWPDRKYEVGAKGRSINTGKKGLDGNWIFRDNPDSLRLIKGCTRYVYQKMKEAL